MLEVIQTWSPIIVALVAIIPTIISNRKATDKKNEEAFKDLKETFTAQINQTHEDVNKVAEDLKKHINEDEDEKAETWRVRILRLDNDIRHSKNYPTQEMMAQGRRDCDKYSAYCASKPNFHNGIGESAMKRIEQTDEYCALHNCYEKPKVN